MNMADLVEFRYPETVSMLRQLRARCGQEDDLAHDIDRQHWHDKYLKDLPEDLRSTIDASDGSISRDMLYGLADDSWQRRDDRHALSMLFWNILACGISGDWRRVETIRDAMVEDPERIIEGLRSAQVASDEGRLKDAFDDTWALSLRWGPAFTTKFLTFTADRYSDAPAGNCHRQ